MTISWYWGRLFRLRWVRWGKYTIGVKPTSRICTEPPLYERRRYLVIGPLILDWKA